MLLLDNKLQEKRLKVTFLKTTASFLVVYYPTGAL
jgi:hypothetical protein